MTPNTTGIGRSPWLEVANAAWPHVSECGSGGPIGAVPVKHNQSGGRVSATRKAM